MARRPRDGAGEKWPNRPLYDLMLNSALSDDRAVETIVRSIRVFDEMPARGAAHPAR